MASALTKRRRLTSPVMSYMTGDIIHDQDITRVAVTPVRCDKKGTFSPPNPWPQSDYEKPQINPNGGMLQSI